MKTTKRIFKQVTLSVLTSSMVMIGLLPIYAAEARGRYGSFRIGGYTNHGKGSHYVGGYVRSGYALRSRSRR